MTNKQAVRYYFELTVSPGFDLEIPTGQKQKECQDEGIVIRRYAGDQGQVFVGVFDGHGVNGLLASKFTGETLPAVCVLHRSPVGRLYVLYVILPYVFGKHFPPECLPSPF
jgi:hypothetical protein